MGVVTGQQAQQQFIEVIARQQGFTAGHDMTTRPFGTFQGADFCVTTVTKRQGLQRQQHCTQIRGGALGTFGHQSHTALMAG